MIEPINSRTEEVLRLHLLRSGEEAEASLNRYVQVYNQQLLQLALGSKTALQTSGAWHKTALE